MATGRMVSWASCGALAVWLLAGCGGGVAQAPKPAVAPVAKPAEITDIQVSGTGDAVQITLTASAKVAYSLVRQNAPPRLFLQVTGTALSGQGRVIPVNRGVVKDVKVASSGSGTTVEVLLSAEALYDIEGRGASIVLNVTPKPVAAAVVPAETAPASPEAAQKPPAAPAAPVVTTAAVEEPAAAAPVAPAPEAAPAVMSGPRALTAIDVKKQADGLVVTLQGNGPLKNDYFLVEGKSLVIDISGAGNKVWPMKKKVDDPWVAQIRIGEHEQPKKFVRVVFDLKKVGEHRVESIDNRIVVSFGAAALAPAGAVAAMERGGSMTTLNAVGAISCRPHDAVTRLEIPTAVKADYTIVDSGDPAKVVVEIASAKISEKDARTLDLATQNIDIVKVTAFPYAKGDAQFVRVVAQLRRPVPFRAFAEDQRVVVDFEKLPAAPAATPAPGAAAAVPPAPAAVPAPVAAAASHAPPADVPAAPVAAKSGFTGRRLSLDFKDADVNDILRLISEVSGLNFVAGTEVKGTVSIKLADVPWDQALDLILKTNNPQLAQIRESDNIVRITTADKIRDEEQRRRATEEDKKKTIDAQKALEPMFSKTFSISYIDASKMKEFVDKLEKFMTKDAGTLQFDERTKNIIVVDTAQKLKEIEAVIAAWDAPTPAVMVEARIVTVTSKYEQQLGVQWNLAGVKDAAHGNSTKYAFPNSVSAGGTQTGTDGGTYMVNLPAAAATSGIGFSFGHIANTLSLDLKLSAMETLGKTKVLSNPKVLVVQNQKALINVGHQLPVTKTDTEGNRTVEWKDVGIMLEVTPQVTNDKKIFLDVKVERSDRGTDVQTTDGTMFSIDTSRAQTKVLIADGETTVIGGIFIQNSSNNDSGVPGLSKIPVLGWLFKSKADTDDRAEMMIFITPRLVVM